MMSSQDKESLEVWVDGAKVETECVFAEEGTEIHFPLDPSSGKSVTEGQSVAQIRTLSSGNVHQGIVFCLILDGQQVPEVA